MNRAHAAGSGSPQEAGDQAATQPLPAGASSGPPTLLVQVMEVLGHGLVMLDRQARVLQANAAAHLACRQGQPLEFRADRLWAAPGELERLHGLIADAMHGQPAMTTLYRDELACSVAVVPLLRDPDWPQAGSLLVLGGQEGQAGASLPAFCQEHRITRAEAQVLAALSAGDAPQDIARQGGVAISTVRSQIAAVRKKVRARSIRQLVQRVAGLPPLAASALLPRRKV